MNNSLVYSHFQNYYVYTQKICCVITNALNILLELSASVESTFSTLQFGRGTHPHFQPKFILLWDAAPSCLSQLFPAIPFPRFWRSSIRAPARESVSCSHPTHSKRAPYVNLTPDLQQFVVEPLGVCPAGMRIANTQAIRAFPPATARAAAPDGWRTARR